MNTNGACSCAKIRWQTLVGIVVSTGSYPVLVAPPTAFRRYEAESATRAGDIVVATDAGASGGSYLDLTGENGGTITWSVLAVRAGRTTVTVGYRLPFGEKTQYLVVNGDTTVVRFTGPANQWLQRSVEVDLVMGANTVRMERFWGYMQVDYLGVETGAVVDAAGGPVAGRLRLDPNTPNPFSSATAIPYELAVAGVVRLDVLDVTGRRVVLLVDGLQSAGPHTALFDGSSLGSGVYLVRLQVGDDVQVRRILLAR